MATESDDDQNLRRPFGPVVASIIGGTGVLLFTLLLWIDKISTSAYVGLLILLSVICVYICGPNGWTKPVDDRMGPRDTPRTIALWLLMYFGVALALVGAVAAYRDKSDWLEVFKSGFLLLGGGVTTIVGYYFGSRQTTQAFKTAGELGDDNSGDQQTSETRPRVPLARPVKPGAATEGSK